jgi:hypothetical protein
MEETLRFTVLGVAVLTGPAIVAVVMRVLAPTPPRPHDAAPH